MAEIEIEFYEKGKDVLLIFTGLGGALKGYQNKYERIAEQVMNDYHFSVAVVATPMDAWQSLKKVFQYAMDFLYEKMGGSNLNVYVMGTSAGANIVLSYSYLFPQIKRVLAVNPVLNMNFHWLEKGILDFAGEKISMVFGEHDPSSGWAAFLPYADHIQTVVLPDIDHQFRGHLQLFLDLPKQYLFNE